MKFSHQPESYGRPYASSHKEQPRRVQPSYQPTSSSYQAPYRETAFAERASYRHTAEGNFEVNDTLLPNEIRISSKGNFSAQVNHILDTMQRGYMNCKVVGRGMAVERTLEVLEFISHKAPQYIYEQYQTKSLNKQGMVVEELHLMITQKPSQQEERYHTTQQGRSRNS